MVGYLVSVSLPFGSCPCFACPGCSLAAKGLLYTVHFLILLDSQHPERPPLPIKATYSVIPASKHPRTSAVKNVSLSMQYQGQCCLSLMVSYQKHIYYAFIKNLSCVRLCSISINPQNNPLKEVL